MLNPDKTDNLSRRHDEQVIKRLGKRLNNTGQKCFLIKIKSSKYSLLEHGGNFMANNDEYILQMKNCRKEFPGVVALDDVSLYLKRGEVHALMGENGAGKSTIMKILAGIYALDAGEILYDGKPFVAKSPKDSMEKGISMIHQELNMQHEMTVEENLFMGRELCGPMKVVKTKALKELAEKSFEELGIDMNVKAKISELSVAQMQMVEIVKATSYNADIIIMDEPTSAITDREVEKLFEIIENLKKQNKAIVYISHKMDEIFKISDRITVIRDGKFIASAPKSEMDNDKLVSLMVGRKMKDMYTKDSPKTTEYEDTEICLEVEGLCSDRFENISFDVKRGEIFGVYGLMGAGRTEVAEAIFGLRKATAGTIKVKGQEVKIKSPAQAIENSIAFISEDRKLFGLNLVSSVKINICDVYLEKLTKLKYLLGFKKEKETVDDYISKLRIKTPHRDTIVGTLSGGNQQKVVLSKWLLGGPDIIIMDEPTRGIDIGAKAEIYKIMDQVVKSGRSIIMISSEMPELLGMSDRVMVLYEGRKTGELNREDFDQERLLACALAE